jgi:N-carbamoylputrescine amidase
MLKWSDRETMTHTNTTVAVGLVQMACTDDLETNLARACAGVRDAAAQGAQIICLQELFRSRYFCQSEDHARFALAEPVPGPSTETLGALARELGVVIIASLFEERAAGLYHNTAAVLDADGSYLGKYRKMHIPDDPQFYEKFYFAPGDLGFQVFQTRFARVGVLICWDQWYPEAARLTALRGAEILFYPTAIGWLPAEKEQAGAAQHTSWETIQRSHAVANGCYVVSVNRTGFEPAADGGIEFWGQSFVANPYGEVLARAAIEHDEMLVVRCDLSQIREARVYWPFLRDRRVDAYDELTRRYID